MSQKLTRAEGTEPLNRNDPLRHSFSFDEEKDDDKPDVIYAKRYKSSLIKTIEKLSDVERYIYLFISKKLYKMKVFLLEKKLVFVSWVGETPPEGPIVKFFFDKNVLKAQISYRQWWRFDRVTTVFQPVEDDISHRDIPTFFNEDDWEINSILQCH